MSNAAKRRSEHQAIVASIRATKKQNNANGPFWSTAAWACS
ncbi:hypothetical protein PV772_22150 [Pseudarthrobacter sp. CC12]